MGPRFVATAMMCASLACAAIAHADATAAPTVEDKKAASEAFRDGDRAFKGGDFRRAAEAYESAYRRAPHYAPLWNAARAWDRAGELARAATLYARYLRDAPANAPDRNNATTALGKIAPKLARLDIHAEAGVDGVKVDDRAADPDRATDASSAQTFTVYVAPGAHVVEARAGEQTVKQSPKVEAGEVVGVALTVPAPKKDEPPPPPPSAPAPPPSHGWSPAIVVFGGAVTAITGGLAIWSGVDTLQQKDQFDKTPTQDNLDSGRAKQARTNVLLGVATVSALATAAMAIFLVDWRAGPASTERGAARNFELGLGPGAFSVRGSF